MLKEEAIGDLEYILQSPAWVSFFKPFLEGMERSLTMDIIDPSMERKLTKPDDYCRGGIMVIRALLTEPQNLITEYYDKKASDNKQKTIEQDYADRAEAGTAGPLPSKKWDTEWVQHGPRDIAPEEDF